MAAFNLQRDPTEIPTKRLRLRDSRVGVPTKGFTHCCVAARATIQYCCSIVASATAIAATTSTIIAWYCCRYCYQYYRCYYYDCTNTTNVAQGEPEAVEKKLGDGRRWEEMGGHGRRWSEATFVDSGGSEAISLINI